MSKIAIIGAGGEVKKGNNGAHRGIAHEIIINSDGLKHLLYKDKKQTFNTPAFNYDEVVTLPKDSILLSSNKVNKVMGLNFKTEVSDIWGIQYHPEITYEKMVTLINFRKEKLLQNKSFTNEEDMNSHIQIIEDEIKVSNKDLRMRELRNWLNFI